jgi:4-aminobutyrate aminotransferase-like enzyme
VERARAEDILLGWTLHAENLVRIAPPLTVPFDVLEAAMETLCGVLDEVA